jgi:glycosyltransferase involved in cell wall biosynthesis
MKKIMFFIGSMSWGGAEKVISILANFYAKKGWSVTIVMVLSNKVVYELDDRIKIVSIAREQKSRIKNLLYWIREIKNLLKSLRPDYVVSFVCRINILVLIAKALSGHKCRTIVSERNDPRFDGRGKFACFLANRLYPKADSIICQSSQEKNFFSKKVQEKAIIIFNPVELKTSPTPFTSKMHTIINAARFEASKNQMMLIEAFSAIVSENKNSDFILEIYGSGSLKEDLAEHVRKLNMADYIFIKDSVLDIQQKLTDSSIFCLTSNYEGMSNSLMEALLLGTPSISTQVSGSGDLIFDGKNGFIVSVGNTEQLKEKMIDLIQNESLRRRMHEFCLSESFRELFADSIKKYQECIERQDD